MVLLAFHKQIIQDVLTDEINSLLIMGKGLGIEFVFAHISKAFCDPHQLVFVVEPSMNDQPPIFSQLSSFLLELGVPLNRLPKYITANFSQADRKNIYLQGGVLFVTSRILIVDLLTKEEIVPVSHVSGIAVWNAHQLTEACSESFILRLFRQKNKTGFIRGFSQDSSSFTRGFSQLEKIMKLMFLQKVHLWPRFRLEIQDTLEKHEPEIVEISHSMTADMQKIEQSIVNIIKSILTQLKKNNPCLDTDDFNLESCYFHNFDRAIRQQLDPIWNQIGKQSRQMIEDLKVLRKLLFYLNRYDCVTFFNYLETLRLSDGKLGIPKSYWMLSDDANDIFYHAKRRVYQIETVYESPYKKQRTLTQMSRNSQPKKQAVEQVKLVLAKNPKWSLLSEIIDEIEAIITANKNPKVSGKTLVLVRDIKLANQLQQYITLGSNKLLDNMIRNMLSPKYETYEQRQTKDEQKAPVASSSTKKTAKSSKSAKTKSAPAKPKAVRGKRTKRPVTNMDRQMEIKQLFEKVNSTSKPSTSTASSSFSDMFQIIPHPMHQSEQTKSEQASVIDPKQNSVQLIIAPLINEHTCQLLDTHKPNFIIMYDSDLEMVRRIEVYKAQNPGVPVRVYMITYGEGSVEYELYNATVNRDLESFKRLVQTKAKLAIPSVETLLSQLSQLEQATQKEATKEFSDQQLKVSGKANVKLTSRRAGGAIETPTAVAKPRIIVDMREFRSTLPSLLNLHGMDILPLTISVGDYIVTKDLCVERKSLSDLWQSFLSGRLFQQATNMLKYYKTAALLIQFEEKQPFLLAQRHEYKKEVDFGLMSSKLVLLTTHFPRLKVMWSRSPAFTARLFHLLKTQAASSAATLSGNEGSTVDNSIEPDPVVAQQLGSGDNEEQNEASSNAIEFLKRLPGITEQNIYTVMKSVRNLYSLSQMSLSELQSLLGKSNGKKLHDFMIHRASLEE